MPEIPVLSGVLDKLNDWQEQVIEDKIMGHGLRQAWSSPFVRQSMNSVPGMGLLNVVAPNQADASQASMKGLVGKQWVDAAYKNSPWQRLGAGMLLDPLNLVGMGIPGLALKAVPATSKVATVLRAANAVDAVPGKLTKPVMDLAGAGVSKGVEGLASAMKPHQAQFARQHPQITQGIDNVMRGWREQALLSPGYHIRNATENILRPLLAENADPETAKQTLRGLVTGRNRFDDMAAQYGLDKNVNVQKALNQNPAQLPPDSVFRKAKFTPPSARTYGPFTPLNRAQKTSNWAVDKLADVSEMNRRVGTAVESRARKGAIISEYERAIAEGLNQPQAVDRAIKYADELFFDYNTPRAVDELGGNLFAFHKFATQNLPAQLRAAGAKPGLMNVPSEYYRVSDEYNQAQGLPARFHGELPIGSDGWHINPMGAWSMGQLVGAASKRTAQDDEGTALGQAANMGQSLGLGLNPFIDAMLTVTGQHGRSFAPGFLRASQPVNGVLSSLLDRPVDIEGAPKELLGNVQEQLTGQRPFPYQEYLLRKRQAELKSQNGDLSTAGSSLGDQMAAEGLAGFMGIPGLKYLSPEEAIIRKNQALAKAYQMAGNQTAYRANPTARAYADLDPRDEMVRNWASLSAAERQRLLRDPEVRDQLLDKLAYQLHNSPGTKSGNPLARSFNPSKHPQAARQIAQAQRK